MAMLCWKLSQIWFFKSLHMQKMDFYSGILYNANVFIFTCKLHLHHLSLVSKKSEKPLPFWGLRYYKETAHIKHKFITNCHDVSEWEILKRWKHALILLISINDEKLQWNSSPTQAKCPQILSSYFCILCWNKDTLVTFKQHAVNLTKCILGNYFYGYFHSCIFRVQTLRRNMPMSIQ